MALAIKTLKNRITENEKKLSEIETEIEKQAGSSAIIGSMYNDFLSWADEFDNATLEQKKMIIGQLVKHVKLERDYLIHIELNMDYKQFCFEWNGDDFGVYLLSETN